MFESTPDTATLLNLLNTAPSSKTTKTKRSSRILQKSVSDKINEGNIRGAVRIVNSPFEDTLAPYSAEVLSELLRKHPHKPSDRRPFPDLPRCKPLVITVDEVARAIKSFPLGSSGGITRLRPQHLKEALRIDAGDQRNRVLQQLTSLVNVIVSNRLPAYLAPVLLGANVTALNKKNGGVRPIAIGETVRRIACKCMLKRAVLSLSSLLSPHQLGCGVRAGIDAAIHSMRHKIACASDSDILLKLDFQNAFNTIRRDHIADCLFKHAPRFVTHFLVVLFRALFSHFR